jgi:hypothetical protein
VASCWHFGFYVIFSVTLIFNVENRQRGVTVGSDGSRIVICLYVAEALDGKAFNDTAIVGLMAMHELTGSF